MSGADHDDPLGIVRPRKEILATKSCKRIKVVTCGDAATGKSCLIKRLCEKRFVSKYLATIGIDFGVTNMSVKGEKVKVNFFDMSGREAFADVREDFFPDTQGCIMTYDVTSKESFSHLEGWLDEFWKHYQGEKSAVVITICANKTDKSARVVPEGVASLWAESQGFRYFETSAQSGENVEAMFTDLFGGIIDAQRNGGVVEVKERPAFGQAQLDAIARMESARDNYDRLQVGPSATKEEINKAYKKMAQLLHPDKNRAPGSESAFQALVGARTALLASRRK